MVKVVKNVKTVGVDLEHLSHAELLQVALKLRTLADRRRVERNRAREEVKKLNLQVYVDLLTGVGNRAACEKGLQSELRRARRGMNIPVSVAILDVDFFKKVNDTYGHTAGDAVLRMIGELFRSHGRSTDFIGRFGGEEFFFIFPATQQSDAYNVAEKFRKVIEDELVVRTSKGRGSTKVRVTVSIGVATWNGGETGEELVARADAALYTAKANGRDQVVQA